MNAWYRCAKRETKFDVTVLVASVLGFYTARVREKVGGIGHGRREHVTDRLSLDELVRSLAD